MAPEIETNARYDRLTIALHWLIAVWVILQWIGAHSIEWVPKGPLRADIRSMHIVSGSLLGLVMIARIAWRLRGGRRLPPEIPGLPDLLARAVQGALYVLVLGVVCGGIASALVRGDSLFGVIQLPAIGAATGEARHALAEQVVDLHGLGANLILLLAGGHSLAALAHRYWLKDGVMQRMLPG